MLDIQLVIHFFLCKIQIALFLPKFFKTYSRFDVDNVNSVEKTETKKNKHNGCHGKHKRL